MCVLAGRVACGIPHQAAVKEVSVVRKEDQLVGLVISVHDALSDKLNRPEFEGLFSPISHYKWFGYNHSVAGRILGLEVCRDGVEVEKIETCKDSAGV